MTVAVKTSDEIERMRVAGRLASEVLDFITPHVRPGVTTGRLNDLCHDYMVSVQQTVPAPLNYAPPGYKPFPKSICTSVNHQVCHGVPGDRVLKPGDRKSTRLNSSHQIISYAVFCLKKKKKLMCHCLL